tara:strand:- start:3341 stop:3697 length:357 start_codon:yes stop_codon:yes gene_type:complete
VGKRPILGLTEQISILPGSGDNTEQEAVVARIDTGATLSSIDKELAKKLGIETVVRKKMVKSASGKNLRSVVKAIIQIHGETIEEEFSLANREGMKYQVLIGQNHLKKGNFLVDPLID